MLIGVVTPAYNAHETIDAAIASVQAQSHTGWRMVVVDDGSTDGTADRVRAATDARVSLIRQAHGGVSAARNRGLRALRVEAYLFLDADDTLTPHAMALLSRTLESCPWAAAAVGAYRFVGGTGPARRTRRPRGGDLLPALLQRNCFVNGGHLLVRAEAVHTIGGFDPALRFGEDWEFWVRVALLGHFVAVPSRTPLLHVRQRPDGAYARLAADPAAYRSCLAAIYGNPAIAAHVPADRRARLAQRADAEARWVIGRELIRHGRGAEGASWLRQSVALAPTPRRLAALAVAPLLARLPPACRGALRPYAAAARPPATIGAEIAANR
ncbi:MAG: hypothetical protein BGO51_27400 [Rhodospirillales bacterium 69-11]|nr:glycosyltransferase [Rhodospirillales bacterium]OJW19098.1 MAG: hypothetical protein BGO51_27400 [Rhodospirillales bacterium 69-11]